MSWIIRAAILPSRILSSDLTLTGGPRRYDKDQCASSELGLQRAGNQQPPDVAPVVGRRPLSEEDVHAVAIRNRLQANTVTVE